MSPGQYKLFLGLIALVGIIVFGMGALATYDFLFPHSKLTTGEVRQTTSTAGHFSISHPERWHFSQQPGGQQDSTIVSAVVYPDFFKLGVVIFFRRSTVLYDSLDEVAKWGEDVARTEQAYEEISIQKLLLKNEETILRTYTWFTSWTPISSPQKMKCYGNYRIHNRVGYVITLCVNGEDFDIVKPVFRQMIDSYTYQD